MNQKSFGFIGGGRVTRFLLAGLQRKNRLPARLKVTDPDAEAIAKLKALAPQIESAELSATAGQDVVFLALHPPLMTEITRQLAGKLRPESILISLAPKFTMVKLSALTGGFSRVVRAIPNAPSIVNAGYNPVTLSPSLTGTDRQYVLELFSVWGECPEVDESKLEAYAITTAMGPTYFWHQFYELRTLAVGFGMTEDEASQAIAGMLAGTTKTMTDAGLTPEATMDLVPVRPMAETESALLETYRTKLNGLFQKIKP
jgi:pyrroline-5-carboxylate reductase